MRKDFCSFLLSACPCLREYGNISYNKHADNNNSTANARTRSGSDGGQPRDTESDIGKMTMSKYKLANAPKKTPSPPHVSIESPD